LRLRDATKQAQLPLTLLLAALFSCAAFIDIVAASGVATTARCRGSKNGKRSDAALLDISIVIYVLKRRPIEVLAAFNAHAARMAMSSITLAGLLHGAEKSSRGTGCTRKSRYGDDSTWIDDCFAGGLIEACGRFQMHPDNAVQSRTHGGS